MEDYPNKIYVLEWEGKNGLLGHSHFVVVVAASDIKTAKEFTKEKIGIDVEPNWLMNGVYPTLYSQTGSTPLDIQAKILYNGTYHSKFIKES